MMKNAFINFVLLLVIFPFTMSCDKDDEAVCLLTKLIFSYSYEYHGEVSSYSDSVNFEYDSNNRLVKFGNDEYYNIMIYDAGGKLIRIEDQDGDYELFTWDGNTVTSQYFRIEDGLEHPSTSKTVIYLNNKNEIIKVERYSLREENWVLRSYLIFTWQNSNVSLAEFYYPVTFAKNSIDDLKSYKGLLFNREAISKKEITDDFPVNLGKQSDEFVIQYSVNYTYDNYKNPFWPLEALKLTGYSVELLSRNNVITSSDTDESEEDTWVETYTYEYNDKNYPTKRIFVYEENDESDTHIMEFFYECE